MGQRCADVVPTKQLQLAVPVMHVGRDSGAVGIRVGADRQVGVGAFRAFDGNGHHLAVLGIDQLAGRRRKARVGLELFFDGLHGEVGAF